MNNLLFTVISGMMYGVPLLIFNAWITLVTYLQVRTLPSSFPFSHDI